MAIIKCKECGNDVSTEALSCPKCGAVISKTGMKRPGCFALIVSLFALYYLVNYFGDKPKTDSNIAVTNSDTFKNDTAPQPVVQSPKKEEPAPATSASNINNWGEGTVKDEMTDKEKPYLFTRSLNGADFNFPYHVDGGSKATIVIRKDLKRKVAYIVIERGHIICSFDDCEIQTRSESGKIQKWSASEASPGVNTAIFIDNVNAFEHYIINNKKIRVGIEFYEYGIKSFDFNVSGYPGL